MLSYQHGFHAGNFADVLKHAVLCHVIDYLCQKDKPFCFHDTHAGRGQYDFASAMAQKTGEFHAGIERLWQVAMAQPDEVPAALQPYLAAVKACNRGSELARYPGSSLLAQQLMRPGDRISACELHPQEFAVLRQCTSALRNVQITQADGYASLKAVLPPRERRGVVLIDPSYELKDEEQRIAEALGEALKRFATGIYLVWYPVVDAARVRTLLQRVQRLPVQSLLQVELQVRAAAAQPGSMHGTGMLVINPPWPLHAAMTETLPWLTHLLAQDADASHALNWLVEKT